MKFVFMLGEALFDRSLDKILICICGELVLEQVLSSVCHYFLKGCEIYEFPVKV